MVKPHGVMLPNLTLLQTRRPRHRLVQGSCMACVPSGVLRRGVAASEEVTTTRANGYLFFSFFSCFSFRFSSGLRWAFFCASFFPLSLLPLSPIFGSPCFGLRNVVDHIDAMIVGRAEAKSNQGESRKQPNSERTGKDAAGTKRVRASSKARSLASASGAGGSAISTRRRPPPCLCRCFRRAFSTRIRRMASAAAEKKCPREFQCCWWGTSTNRTKASCTRAVASRVCPGLSCASRTAANFFNSS